MGFINWLLAKPPIPAPTADAVPGRGGLVRGNRPGMPAQAVPQQAAPAAAPSMSASQQQRRIERNARRDDLFLVVRESMVRAGVMSNTYKFKVLPLDQQGLGFLVMIDLAAEYGGETQKLNEVEALITRGGRNRHSIEVKGVYWRFYEPEKVRQERAATPTGPAPLFDLGANLRASGAAQAPTARPVPAPVTPAPSNAHLQTMGITANMAAARATALAGGPEQAAAKAALAAQAAQAAVPVTASMAAIHNKLLLTGYESTEMVDPDEPAHVLSPTQYGDLR